MALLRTRLAAALLIAAVTATAAFAAAEPTMTAPASAPIGSRIHVTAAHLKPGQYDLTLYSRRSPSKNASCAARLAVSKPNATHVSLRGKIPARIACYSGFPADSAGHITTKPGTYDLQVSVNQSTLSPDCCHSLVHRKITITG
ncbi:MAG: hypothetical protein JWM71_1884 [Solirubrobacteraceae bacterium]|nr:hypothetical protein [Solirubrobacteraceae bacterium]